MEKEKQCRDQGLLYLEIGQLMAQLGLPVLIEDCLHSDESFWKYSVG